MKQSEGNSQQGNAPTGTDVPTDSVVAESPPGQNKRLRRGAWGLVALLAILLILANARRDSFRERWLEGQSLDSLNQMEGQNDADTLVHFLYARRLVETGTLNKAFQPLQRAVTSLSPETPPDLSSQVLALAGYLAARIKNNQKAEAWLQQAAATRPNDKFLLLGTGTLALNQHHLAKAAEAFTTATRLYPAYAECWSALGSALLPGAEPERAIEAFRHATNLSPSNPQFHADLGQALGAAGQHQEAVEEFRTAAELAPQNPNFAALPAIGQAYAARTEDEYHQAAALLQEVLAARPQDRQLRAMLVGLHMRFRQFAAARQDLEMLLAQNPEDSISWHKLSLSCERLGDRQAAEQAYARYQQLIDRQAELTELKKEALFHQDDAGVFLRLADAFQRAGKNREAVAALEQAATLRPDDPKIAQALRSLQATLPQDTPPSASPQNGDAEP